MSTSMIIGFAFITGFLLSYKLLIRIIREALNDKRHKSRLTSEMVEKFKKDVLEHYKKSYEKYKKLDVEIHKIMNEAVDKADHIIRNSKQQMDRMLDENIHCRLNKVTSQVERTIAVLQANTANIAADVIKKIVQEHKDNTRNSEIISLLSRNLNKKLR